MTAYNFVQIVPASSFSPVWSAQNSSPTFVEFEYTLAGAFVNADTITTPANALPTCGIRIAEIEVLHPALDTNASPTMTYQVGDSGSAARFLGTAVAGSATSGVQVKNFINIPQTVTAGAVVSGPGYLYGASNATYGAGTNGPVLVLTVNGVVATGATTGTVRMKVWYWCTGEN